MTAGNYDEIVNSAASAYERFLKCAGAVFAHGDQEQAEINGIHVSLVLTMVDRSVI